MNGKIFEVIVIGAGPSGLMCSYYLKHLGLDHILFDQGRLGESWLSQRWTNFRMITPLRSSLLPGSLLKTRKPESYGTAGEMVSLMQEYVSSFQLPVTEGAQVLSIDKTSGSPVFQVKVLHENDPVRTYDAWQVIIATGASNRPYIPPLAEMLPARLNQLHAAQYRHADELSPGSVLVIGGGQSGLEIAQDLIVQGRQVYLSSLPHPQLPRQYRGREIFQWLADARLMERSLLNRDDRRTPFITYNIDETTSLDRPSLSSQGVRMLGPLLEAGQSNAIFSGWQPQDLQAAQSTSVAWLQAIDHYIDAEKLNVPDAENAVGFGPVPGSTTLDLLHEGITSVIWSTGFHSSLSGIQCPLTHEQLLQHNKGVTALDGLYVVGNQTAGSDYVARAKEDASFVSNRIYGILR